MISLQQYKDSAKYLGVDVATIKAVEQVESNGKGFVSGKPAILFEPHIFWKQLRKIGLDPYKVKGYSDVLYPTWGMKPYGPFSKQHERLQKATEINREAALQSASWGKFQIMGFNYKLCGCDPLQEFINRIYESEDKHLQLFTNYIKNTFLDDELRAKDWAGFARGYNGPLYYKNQYDVKLKNAYETFKKQV